MLITVSILVLAYMILGKNANVAEQLEKIKNIDWRKHINALMDKLRPWALKAGRVTARPLLQFYYVWTTTKPQLSTER